MSLNGLLPREREVVVFIDAIWGPPNGVQLEFIDANQSLRRLVGSYCDDYRKRGNGHSPWHQTCPTIVGSAKMVVRYKIDSKWRVRCFVGIIEAALALQN